MTKSQPLLLTEAQAAAQLSLCQRTLRTARQQGRLSYILIGKAIRYTLADLEAFIDRARQQESPCTASPAPRRSGKANGRTGAANGGRVIVPFTQRAG
jgi:hypothetical protein